MKLPPQALAVMATDVGWAFGLRDAAGAKLTFPAPQGPRAERELRARLDEALHEVRPVTGAPSVGEVLAALRGHGGKGSARVRRRLVAELDALVAQGTHRRAKRQERRRILASLVLLHDLEEALGVSPAPRATVDATMAAVTRAVAGILEG
jgi:hypothetical protein